MNFVTLRNRLSFVLENNDGQVSQAFSTTRLKEAVNWAYRQETNKAQQEASRLWFITTKEFSWPTAQLQFELPAELRTAEIIRVTDMTNSGIGSDIVFNELGNAGEVFWFNRKTLQWGSTGPSADKTLRFVYYASAEELVNDDDEPELFPEMFHELLVWAAACLMLEIADQRAPDAWISNRQEMRMDLYKYLSRGRPTSDPPRVVSID